ncbi:related to ribonuclease P protein subunit p30 [Cephalotrichum gorgonifer]|uniref:Related to ribonuclease P protein subunit p30 n=1 Tax=Cephalotrichum gorgonifer TaxID=2041049 RepID=A0AAE8N7K0_9PEZI|nr:related to ribonuclease P protein subunit p30 [Cephalotrichum gorgonifer]
MFDLNIPWSPTTTTQELERMLSYATHLGYKTVALNHIVSTPLPGQITNPLPVLPSTPPRNQSTAKLPSSSPPSPLPTILHRATILLADPSQNHRLPSLAPHYHLLALRPTTEKSFTAACLTIQDVPLISLDLSSRLPFPLRRKAISVAISRGLKFEISYAQLFSSQRRSNFIANVMSLIRATGGKGLVISSGAARPVDLRASRDIVNLLSVWGLGTERGVEGFGAVPRNVVVNEGVKRAGYRGVVEIVKAVPAPPAPAKEEVKGDNGETGGKNKKRKNGQDVAGQGQGQRPGKKAKGQKAS